MNLSLGFPDFPEELALTRQPNLEAWFARLCERPAYRKIVDIPLS